MNEDIKNQEMNSLKITMEVNIPINENLVNKNNP
jgi:hypothetical protein